LQHRKLTQNIAATSNTCLRLSLPHLTVSLSIVAKWQIERTQWSKASRCDIWGSWGGDSEERAANVRLRQCDSVNIVLTCVRRNCPRCSTVKTNRIVSPPPDRLELLLLGIGVGGQRLSPSSWPAASASAWTLAAASVASQSPPHSQSAGAAPTAEREGPKALR
jgi:hypothetical protein